MFRSFRIWCTFYKGWFFIITIILLSCRPRNLLECQTGRAPLHKIPKDDFVRDIWLIYRELLNWFSLQASIKYNWWSSQDQVVILVILKLDWLGILRHIVLFYGRELYKVKLCSSYYNFQQFKIWYDIS